MSGALLTFETREARTERLAAVTGINADRVLTSEELHQRHSQHTLIACRQLLKYYKETQRWTPHCENEMTIAVTALKNVCRLLAISPEVTNES